MTEWLPLKRFVDPSRPITYGIVQAGADVPGGVPYIRPVDMDEHQGLRDPSELRTTSPEIAANYRRSAIRQGDLVVSIGPSFGKTMFVEDPALEGANLTQGTARVSPAPGVDARFLQWTLQSKSAVAHWEASVGGATFRALNLGPLAETPIPFVRLPAQRAMAAFLDAETARIDALITKKRRLIRLLEERTAVEIDRVLDFRLDWSRASVPRPLADDWPVLRLGFVAELQTGLTIDKAREVAPAAPLVPYLRVANVQDGALDLTEVKEVRVPPALARRSMLRRGDVLMTEGGDPDKLGRGSVWMGQVEPCLHQNHVFAVRPGPQLRSDYLALLTRSSYARAYFEVTASQTTGIASTSTVKIASFRIPLPSVESQARITERWTQTNLKLSSAIAGLAKQIELLHEHRQGLITAAVTGELEVPGVAA